MFKCQKCGKSSQPRMRMNKITVETRPRTYYNIIIKNRLVKQPRFMQFETKDQKTLEDLEKQGWKVVKESYSKGTEIVKEQILCEDCFNEKSKK